MSGTTGKFTISSADLAVPTTHFEQDKIFVGRLESCEIRLDHPAVSRIHAGVNFQDSTYVLVNLTASNILTLNGRLLGGQKSDVLADGDTIQIGPYIIQVGMVDDEIIFSFEEQYHEKPAAKPAIKHESPEQSNAAGVLKVFWEKRKRAKEDWGSRLRPTEKPKPGKAMFNWRPTGDLRRPWRFALFVWAFLIVGAIGAFAYLRYPQSYAPKPLSNPHAQNIEGSTIAVKANANSCTTCHAPNQPLENSCISCHQGTAFHASNTKAHQDAGISCTSCHKEHQGSDFDMKATAIQSCAECHNDSNKAAYNGRSVQTAHGGSYGYPVVDGVWQWKGVYREVADAIPEINSSATGDKDEQAKLSRQFHTIHVARLRAPEGVKGDKNGLVSCSSCHQSFDPVDRTTPRETCAACHTNRSGENRDQRFASSSVNCISCHVQHPFSEHRWNEFLTVDAMQRREDMTKKKIAELNSQ